MDQESADFDAGTYRGVTTLLGAERALSLLLILRSLAGELNVGDDAATLDPTGLASIHRLKSEAGLMGFPRLSRACAAFDDVGSGKRPAADAVRKFRAALSDARSTMDALVGQGEDAI